MYIQITTKCNFTCKHCVYNCGLKGYHMSAEVYKAAIKLFTDYEDYLNIGGGEPTLHPEFWSFIGQALSVSDNIWLATNGSQTDISLTLARLAKRGVLSCALSRDIYHNPIDPKVVKAFTITLPINCTSGRSDYREIRDVARFPAQLAPFRGDSKIGGDIRNCPCEDTFIVPSGKIYFCGCKTKLIGTVFDGYKKPLGSEDYDCWRKYLKDKKEDKR